MTEMSGSVLPTQLTKADLKLASSQSLAAMGAATRRWLMSDAPNSLKVLEHLRDAAESPKVRADCAKFLVQLAGYVPPRAIADRSQADTPLHEMSTDQLRTMATRLEDEIAGRAKDVTSATVAPSDAQAVDLLG